MPFLDGVREVMKNLDVRPAEGFEDLPPMTRALVGYFGYGLAGMFEPKLAEVLPPDKAEACLVLPGNVAMFDHLRHRLCFLTLFEGVRPSMDMAALSKKPQPPRMGQVTNLPDERAYMKNVADAKDLITQGECIQTVLSTRFSAPFSGDPFTLYRRLRQLNPSPYMFYLRLADVTLLGSSPELLVRCKGGQLETCPIAGTRHRGETVAEDERLAREMLEDPKERAEHVMLVDLGRKRPGPGGQAGHRARGQVHGRGAFLPRHAHRVLCGGRGARRQGRPGRAGLHLPAGTLSGAPKVRAMEIIADLERLERGPYGGAMGWIGLDEGRVDLDTCITIRSLWVRDNQVFWQAGAGIVYDSDPAAEWAECNNKARVLFDVLQGDGGGDVLAY